MSILVGPVILSATGGSISKIAGYTIHTFSTPGTSTFVPTGTGFIEVLVVGGGGASISGGGGGGAVIYNKLANVTSGTPYPITVGAVPGGISSCTFNDATIIAYGGGNGGSYNGPGGQPSPFASGGGSSNSGPAGTGAGITGLGFPGGVGYGGGGGAGSAGSNGPIGGGPGNGGIGVSYSITGTSLYYGAGGGAAGGPNGGLPGASYGTGQTPGAVIIRYRKV